VAPSKDLVATDLLVAEYTANLRIILCANSTSRIIGPIRSRCLLMRVGAPTEEEASPLPSQRSSLTPSQMVKVIKYVGKKESLTVPDHIAEMLSRVSQGNLRRALLSMEALYTQDPTFSSIPPGQKEGLDTIPRPDWEKYCSKVTETILKEQTPEVLLEVRAMLYELLVHCIPPSLILSTITKRLVTRIDEELKASIVHWAAIYVRCFRGPTFN
jgi:replication factor C subunit 3/5